MGHLFAKKEDEISQCLFISLTSQALTMDGASHVDEMQDGRDVTRRSAKAESPEPEKKPRPQSQRDGARRSSLMPDSE